MNIPKLKKIKSIKKYHDIELNDDYSWVDQPNILEVLKDPTKLLPEVKTYIEENNKITEEYFGKAEDFVENYLLPMAQRAYANASVQKDEKASLKLVALIREKEWKQFSVREVLRLNCVGLSRKEELDPAINILDQADCIRKLQVSSGPKGGRQKRMFEVNPAVLLLSRASK